MGFTFCDRQRQAVNIDANKIIFRERDEGKIKTNKFINKKNKFQREMVGKQQSRMTGKRKVGAVWVSSFGYHLQLGRHLHLLPEGWSGNEG